MSFESDWDLWNDQKDWSWLTGQMDCSMVLKRLSLPLDPTTPQPRVSSRASGDEFESRRGTWFFFSSLEKKASVTTGEVRSQGDETGVAVRRSRTSARYTGWATAWGTVDGRANG